MEDKNTIEPPQRRDTHGDFELNCKVHSNLNVSWREGARQANNRLIDHLHAEGLDMFGLKMARIACGDPNYIEHWRDIAGYATRVMEVLVARQERNAENSCSVTSTSMNPDTGEF